MINEVIDGILKAEAEAEALIESAKEEAKAAYAKNKAEIEQMYCDAEIQLKSEVEKIISSAEKDASQKYNSDIKAANEQAERIAASSKDRVAAAVKKVETALRGK